MYNSTYDWCKPSTTNENADLLWSMSLFSQGISELLDNDEGILCKNFDYDTQLNSSPQDGTVHKPC